VRLRGQSPRESTPTSRSESFGFAVWQLKQGEEKMIADRLVEIFSDAPKA